jgi:hypothetical protein
MTVRQKNNSEYAIIWQPSQPAVRRRMILYINSLQTLSAFRKRILAGIAKRDPTNGIQIELRICVVSCVIVSKDVIIFCENFQSFE